MKVLIIIFVTFIVIILISHLYLYIESASIFAKENNPYRRTCKICNAQHSMLWNGVIGVGRSDWWQITSEGNKKKCRCFKYAKKYR